MTNDEGGEGGELGGWRAVVSLALLSVVWASMRWHVLTGLVTDGPSAVESSGDAAILAMLAITLGATGYAVKQTLAA